MDLQARAYETQERPALEATIFNHLYTFFSRYYDNGDFLSKRRYSRREKYAVPYNGEEVYLHYANNDQYYVKTGEYFNDYRFKSPYGISVHFVLVAADVEKDNIKGDKRFFVPMLKEVAFNAKTREITIPFQYRPLIQQEDVKYGQRNQQDAIIAEALEVIPTEFKRYSDAVPATGECSSHDSRREKVSYLEHHFRRYTRRNTSDFFVHKDLKGFLTRELDFYLKNEVLNLDEMEAAGESRSEGWFQTMHIIRAIGGRIIEFLAQIEDFQRGSLRRGSSSARRNTAYRWANIRGRLLRRDRRLRGPMEGMEGAVPHRQGAAEPVQRRRQDAQGPPRGFPEGPTDAGPGHEAF